MALFANSELLRCALTGEIFQFAIWPLFLANFYKQGVTTNAIR